jgi:DNA-binding winged helix-turn-helix (wHTH) protein
MHLLAGQTSRHVMGRYLFDDFELDLAKRELRRLGAPVAIEPLAFDVLAYLIANRNRVVGREELIRELWGQVHVCEAAIWQCLYQVRKRLADDGSRQQILRTYRRHGYRFVADVRIDPAARSLRPTREATS